jgi:hypothetical protein
VELNIRKVVFDNDISICYGKILNILFQWKTTTGQKKAKDEQTQNNIDTADKKNAN